MKTYTVTVMRLSVWLGLCAGASAYQLPAPGNPATPAPAAATAPAAAAGTPVSHPALLTSLEQDLLYFPQSAIVDLNTETGELLDVSKARQLIDLTLGSCSGSLNSMMAKPQCFTLKTPMMSGVVPPLPASRSIAPTIDDKMFYCLIHIVRWSNAPNSDAAEKAAGKSNLGTIASDKWYVYNASKTWSLDDFQKNNRVFGAKKIWILWVHLNLPGQGYTPYYQIAITKKMPAPLQDLIGLAKYGYGAAGGADFAGWGGGLVDVTQVPSDVAITAYSEVTSPTPSNSLQKLGNTTTFDDEGKYHYDFSVGVPIKQISQLQLDNVNNTVSATKVNKQNVFGLFDLFPQAVDVKSSGLYRWPNLVTGVKLASQPLHDILLAAGVGPAFANFYIGVLFDRHASLHGLTNGTTATPAQQAANTKYGYSPQFAFGLNVTVRGMTNAVKKATK